MNYIPNDITTCNLCFSDYVCTLLLQTIVVKCHVLKLLIIALGHNNKYFFSNCQYLLVVLTITALLPRISSRHLFDMQYEKQASTPASEGYSRY